MCQEHAAALSGQGRGAVKDTFNLISDRFKGQFDVEWDDEQQKQAVVARLVADAHVALPLAKQVEARLDEGSKPAQDLHAAAELLSELLLQDIDNGPDDKGPPRIKHGTAKDRKVSATDPEMRHGRKSASKTFNGYKASVAADVDDDVVLATDVIAANAHDSEGSAQLAKQAGSNAGKKVDEVLADMAYSSIATRTAISEATDGAEVVAKVMPTPRRKGVEHTAEAFDVDIERGIAKCPAGHTSSSYSHDSKTGARWPVSARWCGRIADSRRCRSSTGCL